MTDISMCSIMIIVAMARVPRPHLFSAGLLFDPIEEDAGDNFPLIVAKLCVVALQPLELMTLVAPALFFLQHCPAAAAALIAFKFAC